MGRDLGPHRPHVHFTPPSGWLNDPNGLVHVDGVWQLCYQHHPDSLVWGPMHWGRAVSRDLLTWEHRPVVLRPGPLGAAFSGSAVVDEKGVAGLGKGALVAFYTLFREGEPQSQAVASSVDGGETWTPYAGNPVLEAPPGVVDFRDPRVLRWTSADGGGHWVMVVVSGDEVVLHRSEDLLTWTECSRFGRGHGAHGGDWETPDLFDLPVEGAGEELSERRWVLTVSVMAGGPAGGTGTQYFVGSFDGETFTADGPPDEVRWVDHGPDFYAPQSWYDAPGGRRTWVAWMSNWAYARAVPASTWRGAMTLPRDLALAPDDTGRPALVQRPVPELDLRGVVAATLSDVELEPDLPWTVEAAPEAYDLEVRLRPGAATCTLELHRGPDAATRVSYDPRAGTLVVRRDDRGLVGADEPGGQVVALALRGRELALRVVVDTCSVEVFADAGRVVLTDQVFPAPASQGLALSVQGGPARLVGLTLRDLAAR